MTNGNSSFSLIRRWGTGLQVAITVAALMAIVLMVNYLAARHYTRLAWSSKAQAPFSPLTRKVIASVTNQVKVIVYFEHDEPLYESIWGLLKEYKFANPRIVLEDVDIDREPATAALVKTKYLADAPGTKNVVVFDCNGKRKVVHQKQLSELDITPLTSGQSKEVKRTHFRGEVEFTSALLNVTSVRQFKAYFLEGHGEHRFDSDERLAGYSRFAGVLQENNVLYDRLSLLATNDIPVDCHLLIIAGPKTALLPEEIEKVDRYLRQGGRLFALLSYESLGRPSGLERLLAGWGVAVGRNVVRDREHTISGQDVVVANFSDHPLTKAFHDSRLRLFFPRSISKQAETAASADAPSVAVLATTGPQGRVIRDIQPGMVLYERPSDYVGSVPLMVAAEKGAIQGVSAERGSTRVLVVGDSLFLADEPIVNLNNREFASHAINWLLARHDLLLAVPPQPIKEYKLSLTQKQMASLRIVFLLGMPGAVLLAGFVVWLRRRA